MWRKASSSSVDIERGNFMKLFLSPFIFLSEKWDRIHLTRYLACRSQLKLKVNLFFSFITICRSNDLGGELHIPYLQHQQMMMSSFMVIRFCVIWICLLPQFLYFYSWHVLEGRKFEYFLSVIAFLFKIHIITFPNKMPSKLHLCYPQSI